MKGTRDMDKLNSLFIYLIIIFISLTLFTACQSSEPAAVLQEQETVQEETSAPQEEKTVDINGYVISEETYTKIFTDIEKLIETLNKIIREENFNAWKKHLTKEYIAHYSDTTNLNEINKTPTLKKYNIKIRSLKDYFIYVVAPSRSDVNLDDISFIDDNNIKAYMKIDGDPVVLYNLKYIDDTWKIGI
jgi:hypothetical protein